MSAASQRTFQQKVKAKRGKLFTVNDDLVLDLSQKFIIVLIKTQILIHLIAGKFNNVYKQPLIVYSWIRIIF